MSISQKYVCAQCGATIPAKLNESSNSVEPSSKECPSCHCTNISIVIDIYKRKKRLFGKIFSIFLVEILKRKAYYT